MNGPHPSDETIFAAALERPPGERAAYLAAACTGDATLRARIDGLLRAHNEAEESFMKTAASGAPRAADLSAIGLATAEPAAGDRIGRYKLLQKIGEGGCGIVYMAQQQEPVVRPVALKVIKLGMDTKEVIARFDAERQALALMDHPNIARVFDAGATEAGRPYFVMELVRGIPITKFCDEQNLPTRARLELFTAVCHAVQHAHQKGIIHRDLKPSNILVTLHDGKPVPKVIDFGIAKATQGRLTDHTLFTAFEQFIGTPAYMSPEQAELSGLDVDTRSDIYSLGVLLYELLTGRPPFDPKSLLNAGLDEIRRFIREVEPPRPSTRLSTLDDLDRATVAKQRGLVPSQHSSLLRGDLDWIVMRCLEKDRTRRYETANGLAADVLRHLHDEPIVARPPSAAYRFQKLVQRNKVAFGAAATVLATLVASTVFSTAQAVKARREAARASRSELLANQEAAISQAVSDFLTEDLLVQVASKKQGDSGYTPNPNLTVREALDRAAKSVGDRFKDKPLTEAAVRTVIARAYGELGEHRFALPHVERAFALQKDLLGAEHPTTLTTMHKLAGALWGYRRDAEGEALMVRTLEIRKRVLGLEHRDTLSSMKGVARVYNTQGRYTESVALLLQALEISKRVLGPEDPETLSEMNNLFLPYRGLGMHDEGEALAAKTWELRKRVLGVPHPDTLATMFNVAEAHALLGRPAEAAALFAQNLELRQRALGPEHLSTMETTDYLGRILIRLKKFEQAESILRPLLASRLKVLDDWRAQVTRGSLGAALAGERKWVEAETLLIASQQGLEGNLHRVPIDQRVRVQEVLEYLVQLYTTWGKSASVAEWQKRLDEFKTTAIQGR